MRYTVDECLSNLSNEFDIVDIVHCDGLSNVDLYLKLQKCHRESYENNQRLVVVLQQDQGPVGQPGQTLQNLQRMINDIDISNFFVCLVTTNPNIQQDYSYVLERISQDSVPFGLYPCDGDWTHTVTEDVAVFSKITNIKDQASVIANLTDQQKKLLFESKTFCMLGWSGINVEPNNWVRPCCEFSTPIGDSSKMTLDEIWNSDRWKALRQNMLNGVASQDCDSCYQKEKMGRDTLRTYSNRLLADRINLVDHTQSDGTLDKFELAYWDIRHNNLCNLSCRSCGANQSSSWYQPAVAIGLIKQPRSPILKAGRHDMDIFDQIVKHIDSVKQIYFAGGEPSMIKEFYQILELLDSSNRHDVKLTYNINMSRLSLKDQSLLNLWKRFPDVSVGASLDGEYQRGEYLRQGLIWEDVIKNRQAMMEQCPHVDFWITSTVSIMNVLHIPEFHKSWVEQGLIQPQDFNIQLLFDPSYLRIDRCPPEMKKQIKQIYSQHLDWLIPKDTLGRATYGFKSVLSYIQQHAEFDKESFWHNVNSLDSYHKTQMLDTFPELSLLPGR